MTHARSDGSPLPAAADNAPALPDHLAEFRGQSVDDVVRELKRSPFFMTSLDDAPPDEDNPALEAIRALRDEGSRLARATTLREQGNESTRARRWRDGRARYAEALAVLRAARRPDDPDGPAEDMQERGLQEALLANRALCQLELQNYRACTLDCMAALELNPRNAKAYYRMAAALLALDKLDGAAAACRGGLAVDGANVALLKVADTVHAKIQARDAAARKKAADEERQRAEARVLAAALKARDIRVRRTGKPPPTEATDAAVQLVPDPLAPTSTLAVPVRVLYPLHAQSDFISAFGEAQTLQAHLAYLLPLPWDGAGEYAHVEAYLHTASGGLVKWGKRVELLRLLSGGMVEVVDGLVTVYVLPQARAAEWVEEVKKRREGT